MKVFLVSHTHKEELTQAEQGALRTLGYRLRGEGIQHAGYAPCEAAKSAMIILLEQVSPNLIPTPLAADGQETPCCDDPDIKFLSATSAGRPIVQTLMVKHCRQASLIGARTMGSIHRWRGRHHKDDVSLVVVHQVALHLAMWGESGEHAVRDHVDGPELFVFEKRPPQQTVTFPNVSVKVPYPVQIAKN